MNVNDSELVARILSDHGYDPAAGELGVDTAAVLINTCAIREGAEARVWGKLAQLRDAKRQRRLENGRPLVVGVLGCMAERLKDRLLDKEKLADLVVGPDAYRDLPRILDAVQAGAGGSSEAMNVALSLEETYADIVPLRRSGGCSAFVSVMRGCNNMCSFCIVPHTRGRERSRPAGSIISEVEELLKEGVKEVTLLGQNVNSYSYQEHQQEQPGAPGEQQQQQQQQQERQRQRQQPVPGESAQRPVKYYAPGFSSVYRPEASRDGAVLFAELLSRVAGLDPELRVRFTSPHPKDFSDEVLQVIASTPNVCKHLHMPAQSGSTSMLARMRRGHTREAYDELVERVRAAIPGVALSTDIICGFCGETEDEHRDTLSLLRRTRYDNAFLFSYSRRDKTHAARHYDDDVPQAVKDRRLQEAFDAFREGQRELLSLEPGALHLVLTEGPARKGGGMLAGRSCTNKRVVFREGPLPATLEDLRQHAERARSRYSLGAGARRQGSGGSGGSGSGAAAVYAGPSAEVRLGDYVACVVREVAGNATLVAEPLARTTLAEFVALLGATAPGRPQAAHGWRGPAWMAEAAEAVAGWPAEDVGRAAAYAA